MRSEGLHHGLHLGVEVGGGGEGLGRQDAHGDGVELVVVDETVIAGAEDEAFWGGGGHGKGRPPIPPEGGLLLGERGELGN